LKVLNLYAGIGGNRKLWDDVDVTAVEIRPEIAKVYREHFPDDNVVVGDAHDYLEDNYDKGWDFIWSSPPCQTHSKMIKATRHDIAKYPDMNLYQEIIFLKNFYDGHYCVENVSSYYNPMIEPQKISRHYFWSNFHIPNINIDKPKDFIYEDDPQKLKEFYGIKFDGNIYIDGNHSPGQVFRNCVHPKLGKHIINQINGTDEELIEQKEIF
jgi:DNA (cytosine-5)-methyltransferase 1